MWRRMGPLFHALRGGLVGGGGGGLEEHDVLIGRRVDGEVPQQKERLVQQGGGGVVGVERREGVAEEGDDDVAELHDALRRRQHALGGVSWAAFWCGEEKKREKIEAVKPGGGGRPVGRLS
jgi:hypothetical protein